MISALGRERVSLIKESTDESVRDQAVVGCFFIVKAASAVNL